MSNAQTIVQGSLETLLAKAESIVASPVLATPPDPVLIPKGVKLICKGITASTKQKCTYQAAPGSEFCRFHGKNKQ